jgi:hypothetical protein
VHRAIRHRVARPSMAPARKTDVWRHWHLHTSHIEPSKVSKPSLFEINEIAGGVQMQLLSANVQAQRHAFQRAYQHLPEVSRQYGQLQR